MKKYFRTKKKDIKIIFISIFIIFIIFLGIKIYGISKISLINSEIEIDQINLKNLTFKTKLYFENNFILSLKIDEINYNVFLNETNQLILNDSIKDIKIYKNNSKNIIEINTTIDNKILLNLIKDYLLKEKILLNVKYEIIFVKEINFKFDFEKEIDVKPYISKYLKEEINLMLNKVSEGLSSLL